MSIQFAVYPQKVQFVDKKGREKTFVKYVTKMTLQEYGHPEEKPTVRTVQVKFAEGEEKKLLPTDQLLTVSEEDFSAPLEYRVVKRTVGSDGKNVYTPVVSKVDGLTKKGAPRHVYGEEGDDLLYPHVWVAKVIATKAMAAPKGKHYDASLFVLPEEKLEEKLEEKKDIDEKELPF